MNPEEFELPGRPLTEAEREALQKDGRLPQSFNSQPTTSEQPQEEQSSGFDLGSALNAAGTFFTENLNPTAGQSLEDRQKRLRGEIEQADKTNTDPVRNFTENLAVSAVDFIDNTFQGDQRSREEIAANRQQISLDNRSRMAAANEEATSGSSIGGEAIRAGVGGVAESLEGILEGADFVGDMGLTALAASGLDFGLVQDKDLTWHEAYQAMDYDFGVAPNNTRTGAFARSTIGILLNMRQLAMYGGGKLPILRAGMGPNSTRLSRLGGDTLRGAIVDFFRNPDEGNIANMLGGDQENANILLKAIAHQDDDNQYTRRLKNAIEGGTIGLAADGLGELIGAFRKGFKFRADPEKATRETLAEIKRGVSARAGLSEQETSRLTEAKLNGGESGKFDPQERAQRTSRFDAEEVEFTQQTWTDPDGAPKPFLDDEDFRRLNTVESLQNFIREQDSSIDINEIATRLKREPVEYQLDTLRTVGRMAFSGVSEEFIDQLRFSTRPDGSVLPESMFRRGVSSGGAVVLKVMSFDSARQMKDIAREILDLEGVDANFSTQALMVLDRADLLMRAKKEASSLSSDLLQQWGVKPRKQFEEIQANDLAIQEIFGKWKETFRRGDIEEIREIQDDFMDFATQLMVTDGDPLRQLSFWAAWARQGFRNFNQVIINGWLSTPVSQARNIVGGAATAIERPLALGIGSILHGDLKRAKAAFHMYDSMVHTIGESLRVSHKSITSGVAVTDATKFDFGLEDATRMEALTAKAKTPQQRFAMQMLNAYHGFAHTPWVTLPSRGLTAGDDFFKTLVTRQEMRYQAAMEASNFELDGKALKNPKEAREAIYQQMVQKYLGVNGEIINDKLRAIAEEATFQTELQGRMKQFSELPDDFPEIKQFMPFIKTPHNLNVQAGMHIPGLARFLDEGRQIMKTGTPEEKAILRGKQALGVMTFALGANLAHQGLLTGFGPADPRLKEVWLKTHQPQSIYIFGKWRSYKAIPVADLLFAAIADTAMIAKSVPESTQAQLTAQIVYTIASMATNRTYFDGLVELSGLLDFESYNYGQAVGDFAGDRLNAAAGMVGLRGALENQHKEGLTEYRTQLDAIMGKLTGGFMGQRIETTDILTGQQQLSGFEDPLNFINPFRSMTPNADPLIAAFSDLRFGLPNSFVRRIDGLELTKDESEFIRQRMYSNGRLRNWLVDYLQSPQFEQKYENWRGSLGTGDGVPRKESKWYRDMIKVFTESRRQAIQALREDRTNLGSGFNRRLEDHQLQQQGGSTPLRKSTREAIQQLSTVAN